MSGWWNSPGHKAILTETLPNDAGVGCIRQGSTYWWAMIVSKDG